MLRLLVSVLFVLPAFGFDPPPSPTVRLPEITVIVAPPDGTTTLKPGQWYIVDADTEQMIGTFAFDTGAVTVTKKKGPYVVPSEVAVGRTPDADDKDQVTIKGPYVYVIKAKDTGKVLLDVMPTVNKLDANGKPIPFTEKDIIRRVLDVRVKPQPPPPPITPLTISATPSAGVAPLTVQFTATGDPAELMGGTLDFGDGSPTSIFLQSIHTYAAPGTFTAKLTTTTGKTATAFVTAAAAPPPPAVLTPFQTKLRDAFIASGATKLELATYAALWKKAGPTIAMNTALVTPDAVMTEVRAAAANLSKEPNPSVRHGILLSVANLIAAELDPLMPTPRNGALTDAARTGLSKLFDRIGSDLETVGGIK